MFSVMSQIELPTQFTDFVRSRFVNLLLHLRATERLVGLKFRNVSLLCSHASFSTLPPISVRFGAVALLAVGGFDVRQI